jgi:multidrug efflux pump subunit AcrB
MIAKNAVILIEQIEAERRAGMAVRDAVVEASASRFRPILLTASSTVLGLIPIAFTVFWGRWRSPSWAGYWSPRC